jgi:hypothetical protein
MSLELRNRLLVNLVHLARAVNHQKDGAALCAAIRSAISIVQQTPSHKYALVYLATVANAVRSLMEEVTDEEDSETTKEGMRLVLAEIEKEATAIDK